MFNQSSSTLKAAGSSGGEQINDFLDGFVGAVIGSFELAVGLVLRIGCVVEAAVGKRSAQPLVKEQEEQRDLNAFGGEAVGVAGSVTLQQRMAFELAQIVAQLVEAVGSV